MVSSKQIVDAARSWIGTPFVHQGRSASGIDCVGLVVRVAEAVGLFNQWKQDNPDYPRTGDGVALTKGCEVYLNRRPQRDDMCPGDIVLIRDGSHRGNDVPCHLGIIGTYAGRLTIIHAIERPRGLRTKTAGKVVEQTINEKRLKSIVSVWSIPGVE